MKPRVTFEDVEQKHRYVCEHIDFCRELALNDDVPANAPWFDKVTTAKWLYGSIKEFTHEYFRTVEEFKDFCYFPPLQAGELAVQLKDISEKAHESRKKILTKYPELTEALSQ
jgi:hypothetical protein